MIQMVGRVYSKWCKCPDVSFTNAVNRPLKSSPGPSFGDSSLEILAQFDDIHDLDVVQAGACT